MHKIQYALRYIKFLQDAKSKFDVHPPFLFQLIDEVIEDNKTYPEYAGIEKLKNQLSRNKETIEVNDLGAGSSADRKKARTIGSITKHSSKPKKYGRLLFRLSRHFKPSTILELGTAVGISTSYMAIGNPNAKVASIEGCPNISAIAARNFNTLSINNVELVTGNFDDKLQPYLDGVSHIDLAFIDGNHRELPTIKYFEQCLNKTVNNSCIVFDDIHWSDGMENAWNIIRNHESVTLSIDLFQMGIVFFRKELSKQHFIIRF